MAWWAYLFVTATFAVMPIKSCAADDDKERIKVQTTTMFAFGGVGVAGALLPAEVAYRKIYKRQDAAAVFAAMIKDPAATTAGKLYALIGLRQRDPSAYKQVLPDWLESTQLVSTAAGCLVSSRSAGQLAREIDKGLWDGSGKK